VKASFWTAGRRKLLFTHAAALGLGLVAALVFWLVEGRSLREVNAGFVQRALERASELAFRFGKPEHARALLEKLPVEAAEPDPANVMMAELRLAVLSGEHLEPPRATTHLERAAVACSRFSKDPCDRPTLLAFAKRVAEQRPN
jgi:hypothetical protein